MKNNMLKKLNNLIKNILTKLAPICMFLLPLLFVKRVIDNDTWFIMNHGRYILENGFATTEPFTIHEGLSFTFEKWLTCILFYKIYDLFKETGLFCMLYICAIVIEVLLYACINLVSENKKLNALLVAITCSIFNLLFVTTRPQLLSYILLLLEIYMLEKYVLTQNKKYLCVLPLISLMYMQLHSTMWPMFFVFMMPYIFDINIIKRKLNIDDNDRYNKTPIIITGLICAATGFINPYGYKSVLYLLKSVSGVNIGLIKELQSPSILMVIGVAGIITIPMLIYLAKNGIKNIKLRYLYFICGTLIMFIYANRNMAYYMLTGIIVVAHTFQNSLNTKTIASLNKLAIITLILFGACVEQINNNGPYEQTSGYDAINYLYDHIGAENNAKLYTSFNTGSYAEWKGYSVYIDPRAEVFIKNINEKEDILNEYANYHKLNTPYMQLQTKYNFDYWLIERGGPQVYMDNDSNYIKLYEDKEYAIYKYQKGEINE